MRTLLTTLCFLISAYTYANPVNSDGVPEDLIQTVCQYNQDILLAKSRYNGCFDSMDECINSPLWKYEERSSAYLIVGAFGYSCNFVIDKETRQVIHFKFSDPGE